MHVLCVLLRVLVCRILTSRVCCVGGRECVVVMCRGGDVYVCAVSEKEISISATLVLGSKVSHYQWYHNIQCT